MSPIHGTCLCGGVAFELLTDPTAPSPLRVQNCHCSRCRKTRGTAHATNIVLPLAGVRYVRGEDLLTSFKVADAKWFTHTFCKVCGATMARLDPGRGIAIVPMGALDGDPGFRAERHIFTDSKAPWHEITDGLPTFPGPPPNM